MRKKVSKVFLWFCWGIVVIGCNRTTPKHELQEGDLLFQNLDCGDLCDAIETVTEGINGKDFSHCAIVVKINDTLKVVEAIGSEVQVNSVASFFSRSSDTASIRNITIARVKQQYENLIPAATRYAIQQIGQPYDDEFLLNNGKWYCSELLYESYKEANNRKEFFALQPMTFKDPKTKAFFPAWINYYKELNKEIPEGLQGINPGLISLSKKIEIKEIDRTK